MNIALIAPSGISGGVATIFKNLYKSLLIEGINVNIIRVGRKKSSFLSSICDDIVKCRHLLEQNLALYVGSIPYPSHIFARLVGVPVALFLHGYVYDELFQRMLHGAGIKNKISAATQVIMFNSAKFLNTVNLYICHSLTVCETNKIPPERCVLLPQWIFPRGFNIPKTSSDKKDVVRIVTYTSYEAPPRLLNTTHLIALAQAVKRMVKRKFELIIVDPKGYVSSFGPVKIIRPKPHQEFL
jgi:hypothetical protein